MSDHVLCASPLLASKLSSLFTALIRHGYIAECLCDSIIQPIPKGLKDSAKSTNFRRIALASCLSKLELCILMSFPDGTSDLQFGYKKDFSTDLCTGLLKLVSSRYIHHGSIVRCALLDMSKAFDMVDHGQHFKTLCQQNLPNPVV